MKVAIIGAGINGMFCSYYLKRRGFDVALIDNATISRTSIYNAGLLTPSLVSSPFSGLASILSAYISGGPLYFSPGQIIKNAGWFWQAMRRGITGRGDAVI